MKLGSGSTTWWEKGAAPSWTHGGRQVKGILGEHGGPRPVDGLLVGRGGLIHFNGIQ